MIITFIVSVHNIQVSKDGGYSFDYTVRKGRGRLKRGFYSGTYSGRSREAFRKVLKRGWAADLAIQNEI